MKVEIYSDVVCPWCYIGKWRFERALTAFPGVGDVEVIFRPFQLDPQAPAAGVPLLEHLRRKFGPHAGTIAARVREAARAEGIEMNFDRAIAANTLDAHRLLMLARRDHGPAVQRALAEKLFEAHFARGIDISSRPRLVELGEAAGMDRGRTEVYLSSDAGLTDTLAEIGRARELGITAVPTFIFEDRYAVQGGQPAPVFLEALELVARELAVMPAGTTTGAEVACADDSCLIDRPPGVAPHDPGDG